MDLKLLRELSVAYHEYTLWDVHSENGMKALSMPKLADQVFG